MQAYLIGALFFLLSIAVFVFQNTNLVTVHFLKWTSPEISLAVVVIISACIGALITFLTDTFRQFKMARRIKELTEQNQKLQKKVTKLEKVPEGGTSEAATTQD